MRPTVAITIPHELDDNHHIALYSGGAEGQPEFGFCLGAHAPKIKALRIRGVRGGVGTMQAGRDVTLLS